jgi:phosphatidylglycerol:prolipoprotein diacylglycerol transferase
LHYPEIDPVIISLGPLALRWYGLAYLAGFAAAWWLGTRRAGSDAGAGWNDKEVSDVVFYGAVGAVLGGRVGYVLFYGFKQFLDDPLWLFRIWDGGMSFHGGLLGVLVALVWFASRTQRPFFAVTDFVAPLIPVGLGLGRLGNFINMELPGRMTEAPWGLIYPCRADAIRQINPLCTGQWEDFARHPSPLYQSFAEGVVLFAIVWLFAARPRAVGAVSGVFLLSYGALRFATEWFRQPDGHLGFLAFDWLTMGQLLSLPMVLFGILLLGLAGRRGQQS